MQQRAGLLRAACVVAAVAAACLSGVVVHGAEGQQAPRYSLNQGYVLYRWGFAKGTHTRVSNTFTTDYTSTIEIEDIWGNTLVRIFEGWTDWWGEDNDWLATIPSGGTRTVPVLCNDERCGPSVNGDSSSFRPLFKNAQFYWANNGLKWTFQNADVPPERLTYDASVRVYPYVPNFKLTCNNVQPGATLNTVEVVAAGGTVGSETKVELTTTYQLTTTSTTGTEWFLQAAMNGGDKIGLEVPTELGKLGVESNFGWSTQTSTKITTTDSRSSTVTNSFKSETILRQACNNGQGLFKVSRKVCANGDLQYCVPFGASDGYVDTAKSLDPGPFETCKTYQFPQCASSKEELEKFANDFLTAKGNLPTSPTSSALASHTTASSASAVSSSAASSLLGGSTSFFGAMLKKAMQSSVKRKMPDKGAPSSTGAALAGVFQKLNDKAASRSSGGSGSLVRDMISKFETMVANNKPSLPTRPPRSSTGSGPPPRSSPALSPKMA